MVIGCMRARTVRAGLALAATEDALRASYLLFVNGLLGEKLRPTSLRQGYDLASTAAPTTTLDVSTECTEFSE